MYYITGQRKYISISKRHLTACLNGIRNFFNQIPVPVEFPNDFWQSSPTRSPYHRGNDARGHGPRVIQRLPAFLCDHVTGRGRGARARRRGRSRPPARRWLWLAGWPGLVSKYFVKRTL